MKTFYTKLNTLLELVVFKHSIFALPFLFISMMVASKLETQSVWFGFKVLFLGIICAVSARNFAMAMNRFLDEDIDKDNPRCKDRPNISGKIDRKSVLGFILLNAFVFVLASFFINTLAFVLSFPILLILGLYSTFKRFSSLAHLVLGFCLGLAPIAGSVIVLGKIELYSVILCLGVMFWTAGFDLLYSLQDMEYDKLKGLHSVPSKFGTKATLFASAFCHFLAVLFWFLFAWQAGLSFVAFFGVLVCAVILFFEQKIVRKNFAHIDRAFFTLNGYLSIIFLIFIWVDLIW
ncbi:4-hydroxybenzoate polyprenyltransferase [Campylobacter sp. MIT 12-8780]|uniref:menaquinone biosynthesis prenyltransferase MqnP n=1 Tax=unclassified Campylobacter TaxID=2593542 RepID=UPI0010F96FD2|nr:MULTISPECIES: menaquinone biosynthesis prenyltransferase MqnP [unclassified Campylobacter]NDJ27272.1 4-hydroxybenzoate polyprenyltransferase [Campylobacter sp. MIT 19-121]TKX28156.1 4-hydroxybenzoate polyprenyltransferase [Campylobacter sp. MIT 12-5580]TQR40009.1 4-hydroxybenzoate polyprenyltransferase [Campylobacter sp. MIT 12-8780]